MDRLHQLTCTYRKPNLLRHIESWSSLLYIAKPQIYEHIWRQGTQSKPPNRNNQLYEMGCCGSKEESATDSPNLSSDPTGGRGLRKPGQTAQESPRCSINSSVTSISKIEVEASDERPRGRRLFSDTSILTSRGDEPSSKLPERPTPTQPQTSEPRASEERPSSNSSEPPPSQGSRPTPARPTLGRLPSGYRKSGQHARSRSQIRREQEEMEASKPYVYTGPPLRGKRRPGQIPSTALPASRTSPGARDQKSKRQRHHMPRALRATRPAAKDDKSKPASAGCHGLRQSGDSAAPGETPETHPELVGNSKGQLKRRRKQCPAIAQGCDAPKSLSISAGFFANGGGGDGD